MVAIEVSSSAHQTKTNHATLTRNQVNAAPLTKKNMWIQLDDILRETPATDNVHSGEGVICINKILLHIPEAAKLADERNAFWLSMSVRSTRILTQLTKPFVEVTEHPYHFESWKNLFRAERKAELPRKLQASGETNSPDFICTSGKIIVPSQISITKICSTNPSSRVTSNAGMSITRRAPNICRLPGARLKYSKHGIR